ncbi:hypothetical protein K1719_027447 [Acacia pycnantha]|nr:hypothetical protein K1719_027447 [Acacia pycnantha]
MVFTWVYGRTFIVERNRFDKLKLQTWVLPKFTIQYLMQWQKEAINKVIDEAIVEAERKGTKVISLGLMNQEEELNTYGGLYIKKHPKLNVKVVDGSIASAPAFNLCQRGIQVATVHEEEHMKLKNSFNNKCGSNLIISKNHSQKIWLVGDGVSEEEQQKAPKGTTFIPYSQLPPIKYRKDCSYHSTPAMLTPSSLENVHSCENWLSRRVMSAWRIAGIVNALEGWSEHECGFAMLDKVWKATLQHGFQPLIHPN